MITSTHFRPFNVSPTLLLTVPYILVIRGLGRGTKVYPPQLIQYDQWGRRVDELHTSEAWRDLKAAVQKEGIPAVFYERKYSEFSRTYGFAKALLIMGDDHEVCRG